MYLGLITLAWLYVALMMAVAEASNSNGTLAGAVFTFLLYGVAPAALVVYLLGRPARRRARERRQAQASNAPDSSSQAAADAVPPVGKEP